MRRTLDQIADELVGKPYRDRGRGPTCYDCFGLFLALARGAGYDLKDPFTASSVDRDDYRRFYLNFHKMPRNVELRPLDVVFGRRGQTQHIVTVLTDGWVLDTSRYTGATRQRANVVTKHLDQVFRLKCKPASLTSSVL